MNDVEAIRNLISRSVKFLMTYLAKVIDNSDPKKIGRVKIVVPNLGIISPADGFWSDVEQGVGQNVIPDVGDWVSVYFLNGDPSKPVVRGKVTNVKNNVPSTENGKQLLYKDDDIEIMIDKTKKTVTVKCNGEIKVEGSKVTFNDHLEIT